MKTNLLPLKQLAQIKIKENPELDERFSEKILFPEKGTLSEEKIAKYGLPLKGNSKA